MTSCNYRKKRAFLQYESSDVLTNFVCLILSFHSACIVSYFGQYDYFDGSEGWIYLQRVSNNDRICKVLLLYEDFDDILDILLVQTILNIGCMDKDF